MRVTYDCCQSSSLAPKARLAHDVLAATSHTSCSVPLSSSPSQSIAPKARREGRTGMDRFPCRGRFSIRYNSQRRVVTVKARQAIPHIKYQRIDVPFEVEERIREILVLVLQVTQRPRMYWLLSTKTLITSTIGSLMTKFVTE